LTSINKMTTDQKSALITLLADTRLHRWRRLIWLSGSHADCLGYATEILELFGEPATWISDHSPSGSVAIGTHQATTLLGKEIPALVFDAHHRFDPDALAAASGAIHAGGFALLLTPDAVDWPSSPDLDKARIAVHPYGAEQIGNRFIRRLVLQLGTDQQIVRWACKGEWRFTPAPSTIDHLPDSLPNALAGGLTRDQQTAVDAITAVVIGHRRRPAVLIADRGRGKSAALGIAAASLLAVRSDRILVTAPRKSACDSLFKHAEQTLADHHVTTEKVGSRIRFVAPDLLIENPVECDLLLVDEAAGLPIHLLIRLLKHYPRIAFATTVHGYEGSGRGFLLRFTEHLDREAPGWKQVNLHQPIRYAENDPLEHSLFQALLLNAPVDPCPCPAALDETSLQIQRINRDEFIHDETQLSAIYGLLVMAHYRTRPLDLRQLLDGPNVRVWSVTWQDQLVAAALVCREGDFSEELAAQIFAGERRPRGHLLAQTLMGHLGIDGAAQSEGERIMRIVVHPEWQGRGIGQKLVERIRERATAEGLQWCGSSFGATERLLRFWGRCQMRPIYIGSRREASSGAHSAMVLCGLDEAGQTLFAAARSSFQSKFPHWLAEQLRTIEAAVVIEVYRQLAAGVKTGSIDFSAEWRAFADHQRSYDEATPMLITEFLTTLTSGLATNHLNQTELQLMTMKLLQKRSWKAVAVMAKLTGRDQVINAMRKACQTLGNF